MKRSVLFLMLLAATLPAWAGPQAVPAITTRTGQVFRDCKLVRVYPDGVSFTHRDGVVRIPFKDLPDNLRAQYPYDPAAEAAYLKEQQARRAEEKERDRVREVAMQEKLAEARMAEAAYLASSRRVLSPAPLSTVSPGTTTRVVYRTSSWGASPYSYGWPAYSPYSYGSYPGTYYPSYSYPYTGYNYGYPCTTPAVYARPQVFGSWNVGHGVHIGVGLSGGGFHLFR